MDNSRNALSNFSTGKATSHDVYKTVCQDIIDNVKTTRASIWYFSDFKDSIVSACLLDSRNNKVESGAILTEDDFPEYFSYIQKNMVINAPDAITNPATRCFDDLYFVPNDIRSLLDIIITTGDKHVAILCCEHCGEKKFWSTKDEEYLKTMAVLLRLSFLVEQRKSHPGVNRA